jgi:hypothetical protein
MKHFLRTASFVMIFAALSAQAADDFYFPEKGEGASPVVWASPLREGAIRALFIVPWHTLRDVAELARRVDLEYSVQPVWESEHAGSDPAVPSLYLAAMSREKVAEGLEKLLDRKWDVIVLGNLSAAILPEQIQDRILAEVEAGKGLVAVFPQPPGGAAPVDRDYASQVDALLDTFETDGRAVARMLRGMGDMGAGLSKDRMGWLRAGPWADGRVVCLDWPVAPPVSHCLIPAPAEPLNAPFLFMEHAYSLVARALLYAAGRDAGVHISGILDTAPPGPKAEEIPPDFPGEYVERMQDSILIQPLRPVRIELTEPVPRDFEVISQLRRADMPLFRFTSGTEVPEGTASCPLELIVGPGSHLVDVWIQDRKGIADWFTDELTVSGWPRFSDVSFSKHYLLPNDRLDIELTVPEIFSPAVTGAIQCTIHARAWDTCVSKDQPRGRLVSAASRVLSAKGGKVALRLPFADLIGPVVRVEILVFHGDRRDFQDWEYHSAFRQTAWFLVRHPAPDPDFRLVARLEKADEYNERLALRQLAAAGVDACVMPGSEAALFHTARAGLELIPEVAQYSASRAVDGIYREPCLSSESYRNAEKGRIEESVLLHWAGSGRTASLGDGNCLVRSEENVCQDPATLAAFRAWLRDAYGSVEKLNTAWCTARASFEEVTPFSASDVRASGCYAGWIDFRRFMDREFAEFHRLAAAAAHNADPGLRAGFRALSAANLYHGYDWAALSAAVDWLAVERNPVTMAKARAFLEAPACAGVDLAGDGFPETDAEARWLPWHAALNGFHSVWYPAGVGTAQKANPRAALLPDGRLHPRFAVLMESAAALKNGLGALLAMSDREPAAIAVGASRSSRLLNTVAETEPELHARSEAALLEWLTAGGYAFDMVDLDRLDGRQFEGCRALLLPAAIALPDRTLTLFREFAERGGVLLADMPPGQYDIHGVPRVRPDPGPVVVLGKPFFRADEEDRVLLDRLLAEQKIPPAVQLRKGDCTGARFHFRFGAAAVYAVLPDPAGPEKQKVAFSFPDTGAVYNLLTGEKERRPAKVRAKLEAGRPVMYAALPYEVAGIEIKAQTGVEAGRRLEVRVRIQAENGADAGRHLVQVTFGPRFGEPLRHYTRNIVCQNGAGFFYIPLARNEIPGVYELNIRDVLSGVSASKRVSVSMAGLPE